MSDKIDAIIVEEVETLESNEKDDDFDFIEDMERFDSAYNVVRSDMEINNDRLRGKERINELQIENSDNSSNGERDIMKSVCPFCGKNALIVTGCCTNKIGI